MDAAVVRVLDLYDQRIAAEAKLWGQPGVSIDDFLLPIGPAAGALLNTIIKGAEARHILEIGTSYGYSTIWLAEAARETGGKVVSLDLAPRKQDHAREMLEMAGLAAYVDFRAGDALELIPTLEDSLDFILLDCWKDIYIPCLERFHPKLAPGGMVAADNMIYPPSSHADAIAYRRAVRAKADMSSVLLSVGSGLEISRKASKLDDGL